MSAQKTTRTAKKRKVTKTKQSGASAVDPATDNSTSALDTGENAENTTTSAEKAPKRARRTASAAKKTRKRKAATSPVQSANTSASFSDERSKAGPEVVAEEEAIVIRFPPAAPSPFALRAPAPVAVVREEPVAVAVAPAPVVERSTPAPEAVDVEFAPEPEVADEPDEPVETRHPSGNGEALVAEEADRPHEHHADRDDRQRSRRRRGRRRRNRDNRDDADRPARTEAATPETEKDEDPANAELTPSQRRRLRRKRRAERSHGGVDTQRQEAPRPEVARPDVEREEAPQPDVADELDEVPVEDEPDWAVEPEQDEAPQQEEAPQKEQRDRGRRPEEGRGRQRSRRGGRQRYSESRLQEVDDSDEPLSVGVPGSKEMVINVFPREECRIAILRNNQLEEIYIERASSENHVGNIYKGIVTNVEPSIQAAFVDFGLGKNGFLHISDLHPQYFPDGGQPAENVGCKIPRRHRPPIQKCLRRGQQVIVQITKEGIGTKGPTLSTYLSIPGRFLVMMPGMRRLGVSRKIEDDDTRQTLRGQLSELELPDGIGFIARTAAQGRGKKELQSDLRYLVRLWHAVEKRIKSEKAPAELYRESDLVIRTIRDLFSPEIGRILVDEPGVARRAREFLHIFSPRSGDVVEEYKGTEPVFHKHGVEAELDRLHSRHVPLRSGGSLVIEPTEALVAIDVNSGRFRTEEDAETTAFKINCEAADEIARQLRLRDLGGVIICDFIDMRLESHKREIERRLAKNLKEHKERAKILRMSAFGIIEMTRQRQRASLTRNIYQDCHHCRGTGLVRTSESVTLDVLRSLQRNAGRENVHLIEVSVSPEVAQLLLNRKRALLYDLESVQRKTITVRANPQYGLDQVDIRCWDQRGRSVAQS